jgi:cobalt-zinc-cadmium efflux system membrane fusion protein
MTSNPSVSLRKGIPALGGSIAVCFFLAFTQTACQRLKPVEGATTAEAQTTQPALFTVTPDEQAHLQVVSVQRTSWPTTIHTTGTVDFDADHTTQAITQVNGPISRIVVDLGSTVAAGDPLLYVSSPDVANAISTYRKARNREDLAKRIVDRNKDLLDRGAIAGKDLESSQADYNDARTDVETSLQALRIFGITKDDIVSAQNQGVPISPELAVRAPIAGTIVQKLVSPGQLIQAGATACFMISNLSTVWVQGHVFDHDLPSVHIGDRVLETNAALGRSFEGTVAYIGALIDPATRTTPVRIVTHNPGDLLKKDMFVDAAIQAGMRSNVVVVPVSAVLHDAQNEPIVYVEVEQGKFAQRSVQTGDERNNMVEIRSGLNPGDRVVAEGSLFVQFAMSAR